MAFFEPLAGAAAEGLFSRLLGGAGKMAGNFAKSQFGNAAINSFKEELPRSVLFNNLPQARQPNRNLGAQFNAPPSPMPEPMDGPTTPL